MSLCKNVFIFNKSSLYSNNKYTKYNKINSAFDLYSKSRECSGLFTDQKAKQIIFLINVTIWRFVCLNENTDEAGSQYIY